MGWQYLLRPCDSKCHKACKYICAGLQIHKTVAVCVGICTNHNMCYSNGNYPFWLLKNFVIRTLLVFFFLFLWVGVNVKTWDINLFFKKKIAIERLVNLYWTIKGQGSTEFKFEQKWMGSLLQRFFFRIKLFSEHGYLYVTLSFCCNQTH